MQRRARAACVAALVAACAADPEPRPNVLVLVPDTIRAGHLSVYGYRPGSSPALERLAQEGTLFLDAVTVAPRTWQSFSSILTGLYPPHHGVRYLYDHPIRPELATLGSIFQDQGYDVSAFDTVPFLRGMTGGRGFDHFVETARGSLSARDEGLLEGVAEWTASPRARPFLAFVRLTGAHWPYTNRDWIPASDACASHDHGFNRGSPGVVPRKGTGLEISDEGAYKKMMWYAGLDDATRHHMIAHYDSAVRQTDFLIGRLLDRMRASGLLDRTIVLVTSDHGESFGEHGYLQHGPRVDENVMRVPLILRLPSDHPDAKPGSVVTGLARVVDVLPTLLDAVGIPPPRLLDGTSLLPAIRGQAVPSRWSYGESGRSFVGVDPERHFPGVRGKHRMIRTPGWKLVFVPTRDGGASRLYDLEEDPEERRDVATQQPGTVRELMGHLRSLRDSDEARPTRRLAPEERELLRELGYVE